MTDLPLFYSICFFVIGAVFGSFFNVIGERLPLGKSIISPSSHCQKCHNNLRFFDMIPIVSFICLKGKCRKCQSNIGAFHVLIEVATALLFVFAYLKIGFTLELLVALLLISLFSIITVSDSLYLLIPDKALLVFGAGILLLRILSPLQPWWDMFAGAFFGFALFLLLAVVSKGGMGGGDVKLYFVVGMVLGVKLTFISIFLAAVTGLVIAIISQKGFGKEMPFGPSIAIGSIISYFFGHQLLAWYALIFI